MSGMDFMSGSEVKGSTAILRYASYSLDFPWLNEIEGLDLFYNRTQKLHLAATSGRRTPLLYLDT